MSQRLRDIGWIVAFLALCAAWIFAVIRAMRHGDGAAQSGWVCAIAGKCGPAGTPGLGRW